MIVNKIILNKFSGTVGTGQTSKDEVLVPQA
jgi:hypothetical protein